MKNTNYVKEYKEFIQDYEDSQKHIKLFFDIEQSSNIDYKSKDIIISEPKLTKKFIPQISVKQLNRKKKDNIF